MNVELLGNASCLIKTDAGNVLCDPWLTDGAFEGSWFHDPPLTIRPEDVFDYDWIYISHIHPDHFDPATLKRLPKKVPVILCEQKDPFLRRSVGALGFEIIELEPWHWLRLPDGPEIALFDAFAPNALVDASMPNILDSSLAVRDGGKVVLNLNDNTPTVDACHRLVQFLGPIQIALMPYSGAGDYPSCARDYTDEKKLERQEWKIGKYLKRLVECAKALQPAEAIPFAGQYVLGGRLRGKNPFLGVPPVSRAVDWLLNAGFVCRDLSMWEPVGRVVKDAKYTYEDRDFEPELEPFKAFGNACLHLKRKQQQYNVWPDWTVVFKTERDEFRVPLSKAGTGEGVLTLHLPLKLFRLILERKIHINNAQVGGHIDFERDPDVYSPDVYTLLSFIQVERP